MYDIMKINGDNKMKMSKLCILPILLAMILAFVPTGSVFAATTADVTVTATPTYVAMTNSEATWAIGAVLENTSYWWTTDSNAPAPEPFEAADMKSTITNTGSVAEDFSIHAHDFTGGVGWVLHATTPAANVVVLSVGITGCTNEAAMLDLVDTTPQSFVSNLASSGTVKWCALLKTGTFGDGVAKSATVTLTATAH